MKILMKESEDRASKWERWCESGEWRKLVGCKLGDVWKQIPFPSWYKFVDILIQCKDTSISDARSYMSVHEAYFDAAELDLNVLSVRKFNGRFFLILDGTQWTSDELWQHWNDNYAPSSAGPFPSPREMDDLEARRRDWEHNVAVQQPQMPRDIEALMSYSSWILRRIRAGKSIPDIVDELYSVDGTPRMNGRQFSPSEGAELLTKFKTADSFRKWVRKIDNIRERNYRAYLDAMPNLDDNIDGTVPQYTEFPSKIVSEGLAIMESLDSTSQFIKDIVIPDFENLIRDNNELRNSKRGQLGEDFSEIVSLYKALKPGILKLTERDFDDPGTRKLDIDKADRFVSYCTLLANEGGISDFEDCELVNLLQDYMSQF